MAENEGFRNPSPLTQLTFLALASSVPFLVISLGVAVAIAVAVRLLLQFLFHLIYLNRSVIFNRSVILSEVTRVFASCGVEGPAVAVVFAVVLLILSSIEIRFCTTLPLQIFAVATHCSCSCF
jgi:hypothetical protein